MPGEMVYEHALEMLNRRVWPGLRQQYPGGGAGQLTLSVPKAVGRFAIHPLMLEFF